MTFACCQADVAHLHLLLWGRGQGAPREEDPGEPMAGHIATTPTELWLNLGEIRVFFEEYY